VVNSNKLLVFEYNTMSYYYHADIQNIVITIIRG